MSTAASRVPATPIGRQSIQLRDPKWSHLRHKTLEETTTIEERIGRWNAIEEAMEQLVG